MMANSFSGQSFQYPAPLTPPASAWRVQLFYRFLQITLIAMLMRTDEGHIATFGFRMESNDDLPQLSGQPMQLKISCRQTILVTRSRDRDRTHDSQHP